MSFLPEAPSNSDRDYRPTRRSSLGRRIRGRKRRNQDATRRPAPTKNPVMIKYQSMEGQVQRSPCRHDCQENHEAPSTATPERSRTTMPTLAFRATCDPRAISRVPGPMGVGTLGFEPRSAGFHQAGSDPARFSESRVLAPVSHHGVSKPVVSQARNWSPPVYQVSLRPLADCGERRLLCSFPPPVRQDVATTRPSTQTSTRGWPIEL